MKLRVGWMILAMSILVAFAGGFLPEWWGVGLEVVAFAMAVGVVAADVRAVRRSKARVPPWASNTGSAKFFENASQRGDVDMGGVTFDQPPLTDEEVQAFKREWTKRYGTTAHTQPDSGPTTECHNLTCHYQEPHDHGFACDNTCTTCGGY